ncbi:MAG: site-specific DNA-methyltransferase [Planctomycetota bacterium]|nr:site-specific DNA-methyltransferase [Planctomycetota bacterium]
MNPTRELKAPHEDQIEACVQQGDCLDRLARIKDHSVDLVYLDPPFNTGRTQATTEASYEDQWPDLNAYLEFMNPRLEAIVRVLDDRGILLLHCDWRTCHHFRHRLDSLMGPENFVNHLIWMYGLGGSSPRRFARKHDDILFYAKGRDYFFEPPMVPATSNRMKGQMKKATDVIDIPAIDVIDVPAINNMAQERVGYPTQKPLALLEMLVGACCPVEGLVLDPFCGSGTTLVAAHRLNRRFLGIDRNEQAVRLARRRLKETAVSTNRDSRKRRSVRSSS